MKNAVEARRGGSYWTLVAAWGLVACISIQSLWWRLRLTGSLLCKSFIKQWDVSILAAWQWSRVVTVDMLCVHVCVQYVFCSVLLCSLLNEYINFSVKNAPKILLLRLSVLHVALPLLFLRMHVWITCTCCTLCPYLCVPIAYYNPSRVPWPPWATALQSSALETSAFNWNWLSVGPKLANTLSFMYCSKYGGEAKRGNITIQLAKCTQTFQTFHVRLQFHPSNPRDDWHGVAPPGVNESHFPPTAATCEGWV